MFTSVEAIMIVTPRLSIISAIYWREEKACRSLLSP
jgi:hypothetical protein